MTSKYQVMPDLSPEDYAELKADIAARGVQVAVEYDENGNILDGHHRVKACEELGIKDWPRVVRVGMTEEQKREHARKLNMARRQLTREQRQELIRQQLQETPERSDRQIAGALGVSNSTVSLARKDLIESGQVCDSNTSIGSDGKTYPRQVEHKSDPITLYNPTKSEIETVKQFTQTASPEIVQAIASGSNPVSLKQPKPDSYEEHEAIRHNIDKAFFQICDRILFLGNDYHKVIRFLMENPNRTLESIAQDISECIESLQLLKAAASKTNSLRVVK